MTQPKSTQSELEKEFDKMLNKFTESKLHDETCAAYHDGGMCCLDDHTESDYFSKNQTPRDIIKSFIKANYVPRNEAIHKDWLCDKCKKRLKNNPPKNL